MYETSMERYRRLAQERLDAIEDMRYHYGQDGRFAEDYHAEEYRLCRQAIDKPIERWSKATRDLVGELWIIEDERIAENEKYG